MKQSIIVLLMCFTVLNAQDIPPKYQMRGAWVATVANIDWPLDRKASSGEQISGLVNEFKKLKAAGVNAVFFQIRTECDALYDSKIEPWSVYLTGKQGKAPEPYYDPLEYAIAEAHKLGMELHAWFNPYRAARNTNDYQKAANHVTNTHPEWILSFPGYQMLNPGMPEVKTYILNIMSDVLRRYDVDGIHFDDYFYPYGPKISNEDSLTFLKYKGDITNLDDWRRANINDLMAKIYDTVKAVKPYVKFGISPFGVVENKYAGTNAFESYHIIYCDPLTWLKDKTVDYITPQLYWEVGHSKADYAKLLPWWASVSNERHLYVGLFSSRMSASNYKGNKSEIENQIRLNNATKNVLGEIFFSSVSLSNNYSGLADSLSKGLYKYTAFPPLMPWKDSTPPESPVNLTLNRDSAGVVLSWEIPADAKDGDKAAKYVIYRSSVTKNIDLNDPRNILSVISDSKVTTFRDELNPGDKNTYFYVVTALDRLYNESKTTAIAESKL